MSNEKLDEEMFLMSRKKLKELNKKLASEKSDLENENASLKSQLEDKTHMIDGYSQFLRISKYFCRNNTIRYMVKDDIYIDNNADEDTILRILIDNDYYNVNIWFILEDNSYWIMRNDSIIYCTLDSYKTKVKSLEQKGEVNEQ